MRTFRRFFDLVWRWRAVWREVAWHPDDAAIWARFRNCPTGERFAQHLRNSAIRASFNAVSDPAGHDWAPRHQTSFPLSGATSSSTLS